MPRPLLLPLAALPLLAAACVTTRTVTYLPNAEQPRLSLPEGEGLLSQFVGADCAGLRERGHAEGEARVLVALDGEGVATESELARSSGDARADGVIGAVTAQLKLDRAALPAAPAGQPVRVALRAAYRCAADGAVTVTLAPAT